MLGRILFAVCLGTLVAVLLIPIQLGAPVYAEETEPECWAVIIGVSHYPCYGYEYCECCRDEGGGLVCTEDLSYPVGDALEFYRLLGSIWGEDHIELLLDSEATKVDIYYAIKRLADKADADDTVLIYFSGHGQEPAEIGKIPCRNYSGRPGSGYFCPFDSGNSLCSSRYYCDPDYGCNWHLDCDYQISAVDLDRWLDMLDSQQVVVILDASHAGSFGVALSQHDRVVMMACQPDEECSECPELGHGVFTYHILRALTNFDAADTDSDYEVAAEEIFSYALANITNDSPTWENETVRECDKQHPVLSDRSWAEVGLLMRVVFHSDGHLPPDSTVLTLDGKPYRSGELPASFTSAPGSVHTVDVPPKVDTEKGTRFVFTSWNDGSTAVSRAISHGGEYTVDYKTQYQLSIESAYGDPKGEGWYDPGSAAHISVIPAEGTIVRMVFAGWSGDFAGATATASLIMDAPKAIKADWRSDYSRLYALVAGIMALVAAAVVGIAHMLRRKKSV